MKTIYVYKKHGKNESNKLYKVIQADTEHECWKILMAEEGFRNLTLIKTKFVFYRQPKSEPSKTKKSIYKVNLKAFTEMYLGTYEAEKTAKGYVIVLKNGKKMEFDSTGLQMGIPENKRKFANRIELA